MKTLLAIGLSCLFATVDEPQTAPKKEQVPTLIKFLKNKDAKTRASAAEDLGQVGAIRSADAEPAVAPLREALRDKDASVRRAAAVALGKIRLEAKETVPELAKQLEDSAPAVIQAAALALGAYGIDAKEALPALQRAQKNAGENKKLRQVLQGVVKQIRASD